MGSFHRTLILLSMLFVIGCGASRMEKPPKTLKQECAENPTAPACKYLD